jgi:hypothetical protein
MQALRRMSPRKRAALLRFIRIFVMGALVGLPAIFKNGGIDFTGSDIWAIILIPALEVAYRDRYPNDPLRK